MQQQFFLKKFFFMVKNRKTVTVQEQAFCFSEQQSAVSQADSPDVDCGCKPATG